MKKLIVNTENEGLMKLMGERVLLMCANYFYTGLLVGVNETCVLLEDPAIVYETGPWTESKFSDEQSMNKKEHYVMISVIESFGLVK